MEEEAVVLSKGINFKELMSGGTEFHLDMNFEGIKKNNDPLLLDNGVEELFTVDNEQDSSSDTEDVLKNMGQYMETNLLASPEYLSFDDFASKMTDCLANGDVKMLIVEEGDGPLVPIDAQVTLHYAAYWEKEQIAFDTTLTKNFSEPLKLTLGIGKVLPGLEIGLTMIKGPTAKFYLLLNPNMTWGELGVLPRIRPERSLFVVNLLGVQDVGALMRFNDLPAEEQKKYQTTIKTVEVSNNMAKEMFKKKKYSKAVTDYHKSLTVLQLSEPRTDEELFEIKKLLSTVYLNLALCYYKLKRPRKILLMCDDLGRVTSTDNNAKCQYYYGKAFQMLGDYDEAIKFYKKAYKIEPKNKDIAKAMAELEGILKKDIACEKELWKNAFKSEEGKNKKFVDVEESFKDDLKVTFEELNKSESYVKFDLPLGLLFNELEYVKDLVMKFDKLIIVEDTKGNVKNYSIVKQV